MGKHGKPHDIVERSAAFADRCIQVALHLPKNAVGGEIGRQITRSGGSVGANVEEAQAADSRTDFSRRMKIALREARESRFWLSRIKNNRLISAQRLTGLIQESEEIVAILTTIVRKTRPAE